MEEAGGRDYGPAAAAGGFSLKDHLFNADSLGDLAREFAAGVPGFDAARFLGAVLPGLPGRGLLDRIGWIAECLEPQLPLAFPDMATALEAALPPPLDPGLSDGDFGRYIHAVHGDLAVRHGMAHPDRALDLIHAATRRFSMEAYIRPFVDAHRQVTLPRLMAWTSDPNYHVRRLVSEGLRPRLPWAKAIVLPPLEALPFLDALHADPTRYVTRSVANHLNDLTRHDPGAVIGRLAAWAATGRQDPRELDWMARHALRGLVRAGHPGALAYLGYDPGLALRVEEFAVTPVLRPGDVLELTARLSGPGRAPVIVDYAIGFVKASGAVSDKVFKWKTGRLPGGPLELRKRHPLKADATTFRLFSGRHPVALQVNGRRVAGTVFTLLPA